MQTLRLGWIALTFAVLSACSLENPTNIARDAGFGPCGREGQRCCDPRDRLPDGGGPTNCNAGLACLPTPMGRDAGVGAVGVCQACPTNRIACNGACVDPSQVSNCGGCGNVCGPGQACVATTGGGGGGMDGGVASDAGPIGPAFACTVDCASMPGTTRCGAACVNTSNDLANCGGCGTRCALAHAANVCTNGMCAVQSCLSGFANCDNAAPNGCEVNTQSDANNCGGCGNRCNLPNATAACGNGACRIMACNAGFADCDQIAANGCEVNVGTDASNCARCGMRCPTMAGATAICTAGRCDLDDTNCTAPLASCDGNSTNGCEVNTNTDVNNCGRCRNVCTVTNGTPVCAGGSCAIGTCNSGRADCNRMLMDGCEVNITQGDINNCGGCGNRCNLLNATAVCMAGGCRVSTCNTGFADCDGMPSNGCEQSVRSDNANCGACGNACTSGRSCTNGACVCPSGQTFCMASNACLNLQSDNNNCGACGNACGGGTSCQMGVCRCPTGQTLCGGVCVNLSNDLANCGTCGTRCASGEVCSTVSGMTACRVSCPSGQQNCSGSCVVLATDSTNCGTCGTRCRTGESCTGGTCGCPSGQSFCAGVGCVNRLTDNTNCGACGNACTNGRFCSNGACTCPSGQTFCSASNACQNLQTDNANCGACGNVCTTGQACVAGVCQNTCPSGQTFCSGQCRDTRVDANNCGACGTVCTNGRTCQSSTCACPSGQTLCGTGSSATCRNLQSDNANCGTCGTPCMGGTSCQSGMCRCPAGQTLCSGVCVNTSNDTDHCGACGTACASGQVCASGVCGTICTGGQTNCSGVCRVLSTDVDGCGSCTNVCAVVTNGVRTCVSGGCGFTCNTGFVASMGACVACGGEGQPACTGGTCNSGLNACGGICRNTSSSTAHCGMSCTVCAVPTNGSATCASSVCGINCNPGFNPSGSMCVPCGADGQPACVSGTACSTGTVDVSGTCRTCGGLDQPACSGGVCNGRTVNVSGTCRACGTAEGQPACTTGTACDPPYADCSGTCRDVRFDPAHCGTCNNDCGGAACNSGSCNSTLCGTTGTRCGVSPGMSMNCMYDTMSCTTGTATTITASSMSYCVCL